MKLINNIIKKEIDNFLISESLTDIVYHFTSLDSLLKIIKYDKIFLGFAEKDDSEDFSDKAYYLCLTRQRNGNIGHSIPFNVRITLDGRFLNYNFKGRAINYWRRSGGINKYMRKLKKNRYRDAENEIPDELKYQKDTENEDRLFSDMPTINNISRYIIKIDIIRENKYDDDIFSWILNNTKFKNIVNIYSNKADFNSLTSKNINYKYVGNNIEFSMNEPKKDSVSKVDLYEKLFINIVIYLVKKKVIKNKRYNANSFIYDYINYLFNKYIKYFINNDENKNHELYNNICDKVDNDGSNLENNNHALLHYEIIPSLRDINDKKIVRIATKMLRDE